MKKPLDGVAFSELLYDFEQEHKADSNIPIPNDSAKPLAENACRDAKAMAALFQTLKGGLSTYKKVFDALETKYAVNFFGLFLSEMD